MQGYTIQELHLLIFFTSLLEKDKWLHKVITQLPSHSQAPVKKGRERNVSEKIRLDTRLELLNTT